jgi:hypothetical protein
MDVKIVLEDMYTSQVFEEKIMKEIYRTNEKFVKREFYLPNYKILSSAWNEYETHLQAKKYVNKVKNKVKEFSFIFEI